MDRTKKYIATLMLTVAIVAIGASMNVSEAAWRPLHGLYVNHDDAYQSVYDTKTDKLIAQKKIPNRHGWISNQYNAGKIRWAGHCCEGVWGVNTQNFDVECKICTGPGVCPDKKTGYPFARVELTPDGKLAIAQTRDVLLYPNGSLKKGTPSRIMFIDADSDSPSFCSVLNHHWYDESVHKGPNDVTISPDGKYVYVPDIHSETITVVDIAAKTTATITSVPRINALVPLKPSHGTLSPYSDLLFVENEEGAGGSLSVFDVATDPINPAEIVRFVQSGNPAIGTTLSSGALVKGGLGLKPMSNEFTPDNKYSLVINKMSSSIDIVNTATLAIDHTINLDSNFRPEQGDWTKNGKKFYVTAQSSNTAIVPQSICYVTYDPSKSSAATAFSSATCFNTGHFKKPNGLAAFGN